MAAEWTVLVKTLWVGSSHSVCTSSVLCVLGVSGTGKKNQKPSNQNLRLPAGVSLLRARVLLPSELGGKLWQQFPHGVVSSLSSVVN